MKVNLELFEKLVTEKYQKFSELFLTLPFSPLHRYGEKLPIFKRHCIEGLSKGLNPQQIIQGFFHDELHLELEHEQNDVLFLFLQLIERQIVLFDATEDAAKPALLAENTECLLKELPNHVPSGLRTRLVLTAHPTQFYPESVLGIIQDLSTSISRNDQQQVNKLLLQLGRTSLTNPERPLPLQEAEMLLDRFGTTFYSAILDILKRLSLTPENIPRIELGFWPGGDRDGHPMVSAETTRMAAQRLRSFILTCYLEDFDKIRRRITFKHVTHLVREIRQKLFSALHHWNGYHSAQELIDDLSLLKREVDQHHEGLFREHIQELILAVHSFGFYFASLDIRQSSRVFASTVSKLYPESEESLTWLSSALEKKELPQKELSKLTEQEQDILEVLKEIPEIQKANGEQGCHRIVISHSSKPEHVLQALLLTQELGEQIDIVPLFESIDTLREAKATLKTLFQLPYYRKHLEKRRNKQTVMLGFSDGTKDGGYLTCNWEIQQAKEELSQLAEQYQITITFFDGRGGPAGRGGGNTGKYYQAVAGRIPIHSIEQTVQGQTISSYYGIPASAQCNLLNLLQALKAKPETKDRKKQNQLLSEISERAYRHYCALKNHPDFLPLLEEATPLKYFEKLNLASRPPKRRDGEFSLDNLRAIPFVGTWSLMKLNIPAFYGMGLSFDELAKEGRSDELMELARSSKYFQSLLGNSAQSLRKSFYPLTDYLDEDPRFREIWELLRDEALRSEEWILKLTGKQELLADTPTISRSIALREEIILPLLVIQHAALMESREDCSPERRQVLEKLILKSIPPSINASRNSA